MEDQVYIVTLHKHEDLEQFYKEMQLTNFPLVAKRPLSRNTHYMMTEEQAEVLRQDARVWAVEKQEDIKLKPQTLNYTPYNIVGDFFKNAPGSTTLDPTWRQWGQLHIAGDPAQRRKNANWGDGSNPVTEIASDTIDVFGDGKYVDVVLVDDPISYDCEEWHSPTTNQTRFVQYQWFNELNTLVNSIDDDGQVEPTGTITYHSNTSNPYYHGNHVCGIACGQHYGWARESNIYNLAVTGSWQSGQQVGAFLIFDYLRAFHRNKPVNTDTGIKNPTVTNHSYGGIWNMPNETTLQFSDVTQIVYRGTAYNSGNPGPSGWTQAGVEVDFGVRFNTDTYPAYNAAIVADVQDAVEEGIVVVGAAGNDNMLMASVNDDDWNNTISITGVGGNLYYNRGAWPNTTDSGAINVGALSDVQDFRRSTYTQFGPGVDVFAPGDDILSAYNNTGFADGKYGGNPNYYYPIPGTSMASPQVAGVLACFATGKDRFTNADVKRYLQKTNIDGDMTFDVGGGGYDDDSCRKNSPNKYVHIENPRQISGFVVDQIDYRQPSGCMFPRTAVLHRPQPSGGSQTITISVGNSGASHYVITGADRSTTHDNALDPTINVNAGDTLEFNVNASGHPFYIKTSATTGTGNQVTTGTITGNGASVGTVTWDTTGVTSGTYYYICQFHSGMVGQIVIS